MAEELGFDVFERILVRLDVRDLIRCKSVCKSWKYLISSPCFVKAHLKHAYKNDRDHNHEQLGHRRIANRSVVTVDDFLCCNLMHIVGSCNGLVCFSPKDAEFIVTNPSTREEKKLQTPPFPRFTRRYGLVRNVVCWGFGYDSAADDYKVIVGHMKSYSKRRTLFFMLTLKSNVWKAIGEVNYRCCLQGVNGILSGGALHWFMRDANKRVIISLDLSTEEFKETPQPADREYESHECDEYVLGVLEGCLCIYTYSFALFLNEWALSSKQWVMKNNKWELYNNNNHFESKYDVVHDFSMVDSQWVHDVGTRVPSTGGYIRASIFVKSLVSPHTHVGNNNNSIYYEGQNTNAMMQGREANESGESNIRKRKRNMRRKRFSKHKKPLV